jgi:glycosyltransferase involved in cell wall biosynthesis
MSVTVVIPTYNRGLLACEAIKSVLSQTYKDFEIIVIDDGSKDNTETLLSEFGQSIRYYKQPNMGPGKARNRGIELASGQYVAFLDSDDLWLDFKLELQVRLMERLPHIGFLSTNFTIARDSQECIPNGFRTWYKKPVNWANVYGNSMTYSSLNLDVGSLTKDFTIYIGNLYARLLEAPYVLPSTSIVRRSCLTNDIKFSEGVWLYEDWEFFARLSRHYNGGFLDVDTVINRGHDDGIRLTRCSRESAAENRLGLVERVWKSDPEFREEHSEQIARVEADQFLILAKEQLLASEVAEARSNIKLWMATKRCNKVFLGLCILLLSYLPKGDQLFVSLRNMLNRFRELRSAVH